MNGAKDDRLYLVHILESIERIRRYTVDGRDAFLADDKTQDAVVRNLQTLAESTQRLAPETRARYPGIDWRRIGQFRNVVVHQYRTLNYARIWSVVETYLDPLERAISDALARLDSPPESEE
ncbi:MAG TPA: HepT-like ribonuclease domain-containing protein [Chloroflexota bacterium]|nr:HepT-like ribonuclease domain-containing protein [Chloroflexota bacterium]